jgi:hypothetical protein
VSDEKQPWQVERDSQIAAMKTSELIGHLAYCLKHSWDSRLDYDAKAIAEEIDRRIPVR